MIAFMTWSGHDDEALWRCIRAASAVRFQTEGSLFSSLMPCRGHMAAAVMMFPCKHNVNFFVNALTTHNSCGHTGQIHVER